MANYYMKNGKLVRADEKKKKKGKNYIMRDGKLVENVTVTAPVKKSGGRSFEKTAPVKEEKRTWFDKGAFDDGYQKWDVTKAVGGTILDAAEWVGTGLAGLPEKLGKGLLALGTNMAANDIREYAYTNNLDPNEEVKKAKEETAKIVKKDWYDEHTLVAKNIIDPTEEFVGLDPEGGDSVLGEKTQGVLQSGGQLLGTAALQAVGVPWFVTTGVSSYGTEVESALNEGASWEEANISGLITAGAEILTEKISGGIKFGGKALDDLLTDQLAKSITNKFVRTALKLGLDVGGEAGEEWLATDISNFGKWLTYRSEEELSELLFSEEAMDEKIEAAIGGGLLGGFSNAGKAVVSNVKGIDYTTGLTKSEQKVLDAELKNRIAEAEKGGKKLTAKEKADIRANVMESLKRGEISTDTIEEVLSGDSYKAYQDAKDSESALMKEYESQAKELAENGDTDALIDLAKKMGELKKNPESNKLKAKLSTETYGIVKSGSSRYLAESYNEVARRKQALSVDLNQYEGEQKRMLKDLMDKELVNNARYSRDFWTYATKAAADKGITVTATTTEEILEMETKLKGKEWVEKHLKGKIVNAYIMPDGSIGINIKSKASRYTLFGHEIGHLLENVTGYKDFQKHLFAYAETKEGKEAFAKRRAIVEDLYSDDLGKVDIELTNDLIGEYIYDGDTEFVRRLSVENKNIFQKIWDEIKYLCKVATAGSQEQKDLLRLEKEFEKIYRESGKVKTEANGEPQFSLYTDFDGNPIESDRISSDELDAKYSLSHNADIEKGQTEFVADKSKKSYVTSDELEDAQEVTRAMVDVMMKYSSILPEDKIGKVLTKNGSYDRSVENTTICVRTLAYNEFVDKVQEEIGRPLTQMESFLVSQKLYDIATEPQCLYCYVSLDRKAFNDMLLRYMQDRDTVIAKYNNSDKSPAAIDKLYEEFLHGRKDTKNMKERFNKWIGYVDNGTQLLSLADIATEDSQSVINANGGILAEQLKDARAYAQSASWSKIQKNYVAYRDEILKLGDRVVKNLNEHYGMRWYSFSDYSAAFIVENMQQITDASIRGLKGLAYTKDTDFAEIFAPSGMNVNISVFVNQDADGNFFIDEKQSANFEKALELRERYPNVGIVATVTNDEALRWVGQQAWSDVIIPFHIVRTGTDVAEYYKWLNYTSESADTVSNKDLWEAYLDSLNLKSENARKKVSKNIYPSEHKNNKDTYLNLCESRGLAPRFARFVGEDWYMKLVNETRLSSDESSPLKPSYNLEAAKLSFQKFVDKGGYEGGWYKEGVDVDAEAKVVADDVIAGKKANEVDYGRQDGFVPEAIIGNRKNVRSHGFSLSYENAPKAKDAMSDTALIKDDELIKDEADDFAPLPAKAEPASAPITEEEAEAFAREHFASLTDADAPMEQEADGFEMRETSELPKTKIAEISKLLREKLGLSNRQMALARGLIEEYSKNESISRDDLYETIKAVFGMQTQSVGINLEEARKFLRNTKINVSKEIQNDLADYEDKRKSIARKVKFSEDGRDVNFLYGELNTNFPDLFPAEITKPSAQFDRIVDVLTMDSTEDVEVDDAVLQSAADIIVNEVSAYHEKWRQKLAESAGRQPIAQSDIPVTAEEFNARVEKVYESLANKPLERLQKAGGYSFFVSRDEISGAASFIIEKRNGEKIRHRIDDASGMTDAQLWRVAAEKAVDSEMPYVMDTEAEHPMPTQPTELEKALKRIDSHLETDKKNLDEEFRIRREETQGDYDQYALDEEYNSRLKELEEEAETKRQNAKTAIQRKTKNAEHESLIKRLVGDTSTWVDKKLGLSYKVNTLRRNLRYVVRDANGKQDIARADEIDYELQGKYDIHEAMLNREANRIKKVFADMKITKAESEYIQMLGEFRHNPETKLTEERVKEYLEKHKKHIDEAKVDKAIALARETYDSLLERVNAVLREQGMKEIPYRKGYFPHFTEQKPNLFEKILNVFNWKTQNNDIPTSIAGLTEEFNPNRSWQPFNKQRKGDTTDYNFLKGLDNYVFGALDWIYHIDDIQKRRALENYIRYIHSEEGVQQEIDKIRSNDSLDADQVQDLINAVYRESANPLGNFVQDLRAGTNALANKKSSLDRTTEELVNRQVYSILTNISNRVSANAVVGSFSAAIANIIPITQSWVEVAPWRSLQAMKSVFQNTIRDDGMIEKSAFLTNRLRSVENLYKSGWDKVGDVAGFMMEIVDNFSSQVVWRSKYIDNIVNGMSESDAIQNADQFAKNVIAGRSRGNMPTIFESKNLLVKLFTAFQLEVNNQYGYMFKDAPKDMADKGKARLVAGYATAFIGASIYNALYSSLVGRDAAFDPIGIISDLLKDMGIFGDDDEEEKEPKEIIKKFGENVAQEIPFVGGVLGGGRVPISSSLPYEGNVFDMIDGWGEAGATKEWLKPLYYLLSPMGGGQIKKINEGIAMYSEDHPLPGSYTSNGNLRFPVEDDFWSKSQAVLFGQYASKNAREYFDNGYAPLEEKQIQEFMDVDVPIGDYWKYREGLKGLKTAEEKTEYINSLDLNDLQKNLLINNLIYREDGIDMSDYDSYGSYDEFDYAQKNPEKYTFFQKNGISFKEYDSADEDTKDAYNWAYEYPEKYTLSKAVTSDVTEYRRYKSELDEIRADKDSNGKTINGSSKKKKAEYIFSLPLDYGQQIILYRSIFDSQEDKNKFNRDIVRYLNSRNDITYSEMETILLELDFKVSADGSISW